MLHPAQVEWTVACLLHGRPELRGLGLVTILAKGSETPHKKSNSFALVFPSRPMGHLDFAQCVSHKVSTEGDKSSAYTPLDSRTQKINPNRTAKKKDYLKVKVSSSLKQVGHQEHLKTIPSRQALSQGGSGWDSFSWQPKELSVVLTGAFSSRLV